MVDKRSGPGGALQHPEARITEVLVSVTNVSVLRDEVLRMILREALNRYRNKLMDDEERQLLLVRIKRLRWSLGIVA